MKATGNEQKTFEVKGCDDLSRKDVLWKCIAIEDVHEDKASGIVPESHEPFVDND